MNSALSSAMGQECAKVIKSVRAIPFAIREPTERELAYGKLAVRRNVIVIVEDDSGIQGVAETAPIPIRWGCEETPETIVAVVNGYVAPLLIGKDPATIGRLLDEVTRAVGWMPYARAGVCDALYDLLARLLRIPIATLLGGRRRETIECSWSIAFKSEQEMAKEAAWAKSQGFRWIKVKIGSRDPGQDLRNVAAVREAVGPEFPIHVDANGGYTFLDASHILPRIERYNPRLIEQPVAGWNLEGMRDLRRKLRTPIMADESVRSYRDLMEVIRREAADAVLMKLAKHGGIDEARKIADLAASFGMAIYPGIHFTTSVGVATSAQFYSTLPSITPGDFHMGPLLLERDLVRGSLKAVDGVFKVPDGPGNGVELAPDLLEAVAESTQNPK